MNITRLKMKLGLATGLLGLFMAFPAAAANKELVDAAKAEGEVTWYTSYLQDKVARPMAAKFEATYPGIKVNVVGGTAGDLLLKMLNERAADQHLVDVGHGGSSLLPLKNKGYLEAYTPESAANYAEGYKDADGFGVASNLYFLRTAVNTDMVDDADIPHSYEDLLNPKWKGQILWTGNMVQGGPLGFIAVVMKTMGEEVGTAYLEKLKQQSVVSYPANQRVVLDQVIAGEFPIALMVFTHHVAISQEKGAPIEILNTGPALGIGDPVFLLSEAPHPNAGKLLMDFILSADGQTIFRDAGYIPASPEVEPKDPKLRPEGGKFEARIILPAEYDAGVAEWTGLYDNLFK